MRWCAEIAQLVEHVHGKDEVVGSIPTLGSKIKRPDLYRSLLIILMETGGITPR